MQKFKISKRIKTIVSQAMMIDKPLAKIADIGTDHGYLPYLMISNKLASEAILCDINSGPLDNAMRTFNTTTMKDNVTFRLGSGIEPLYANEVDMVFIAGMGGGLIKDILEKDIDKSKSFPFLILQPMTEQDLLRDWLIANGIKILWDHFFVDAKKHYELIVATTLNDVPIKDDILRIAETDLEFGTSILKGQSEQYLDFLRHKEIKYVSILEKIKMASRSSNEDKYSELNSKLEIIKRIRNTFK